MDHLKSRMLEVYQSKGFKVLSSHLKHLKSDNSNNLESLMAKLNTTHATEENGDSKLTVVYDRSKKDIALLIRLYALQKRINTINTFVGGWKPVSILYLTLMYIIDIVEVLDSHWADRV